MFQRELFHIAADFTISSTEYSASVDNVQKVSIFLPQDNLLYTHCIWVTEHEISQTSYIFQALYNLLTFVQI